MTEDSNVLVHSLFSDPILHVRSNQDTATMLHRRRRVAIVGARAATDYGLQIAMDMGRELAKAGVTVISGLAFGIDSAAHRGAVDACGFIDSAAIGRPLAVLPCGLDRCYPQAHQGLLNMIIDQGMAVSQFEDGTPPTRHRFLERNRVIAQLAEVIVVVEATSRSGSLSCLQHGRDLGRRIAAVPGPVNSMTSIGCHRAIRDGATLVTSANDVLDLLDLLAKESS